MSTFRPYCSRMPPPGPASRADGGSGRPQPGGPVHVVPGHCRLRHSDVPVRVSGGVRRGTPQVCGVGPDGRCRSRGAAGLARSGRACGGGRSCVFNRLGSGGLIQYHPRY